MSVVQAKICGLRDPSHAEAACRAGAAYVGVVFAGQVRRVTREQATGIVDALVGGTWAVGVFVDEAPAEILRQRDVVGFHVAQLHGSEPPSDCEALRAEGLGVWKALRPTRREALQQGWARFADVVDAILVEGFSAKAAGGTGSRFPYEWLADLDRGGPKLALAGGLNARNVGVAVDAVRPDIVDVSSGVEATPGEKSIQLMQDFLRAASGLETGAPAAAGRGPISERS